MILFSISRPIHSLNGRISEDVRPKITNKAPLVSTFIPLLTFCKNIFRTFYARKQSILPKMQHPAEVLTRNTGFCSFRLQNIRSVLVRK